MEQPEKSIRAEVEEIKSVVNSHSNHLGTLQGSVNLILSYMKFYGGALALIMGMIAVVIILAVR